MGAWKSIKEMEETLTLEEAYLLMEAMYRKEERHNKFAAAIQGINLDEHTSTEDEFERIKRRAEAELTGRTEEEVTFEMIIEIESDDDD